jgi:hypothetical protein
LDEDSMSCASDVNIRVFKKLRNMVSLFWVVLLLVIDAWYNFSNDRVTHSE